MITATEGFPGKGMTYEALPHLFSAPDGAVETARLLTLFLARVWPRCFDCGGRYSRGLYVGFFPQRFFPRETGKGQMQSALSVDSNAVSGVAE